MQPLPEQLLSRTSNCGLCGMLCSVGFDDLEKCPRRASWMNPPEDRQKLHSPMTSGHSKPCKLTSSPLIWLDSCDVRAARSAVALAQRTQGTVHVGQSTGSRAVKRVVASAGWFGTTLSEVAARADLAITLGDGVVKEAPLLPSRFLRPDGGRAMTWIHITPHAVDATTIEGARRPDLVLHWPREEWLVHFTEVALGTSVHPVVQPILEQLDRSLQSVWIWDVDDLHCEVDELVVRRLVSIAAKRNAVSRCALLPLDLNAGRVTAEETLLWLTGCPGTATWNGHAWISPPELDNYSIEQWNAAFDSIIVVSNLPSDRPIPNLRTQLSLVAHPPREAAEQQVSAVGVETPGHLFRCDKGLVQFLSAAGSELPHAAEVLDQIANTSATLAEPCEDKNVN